MTATPHSQSRPRSSGPQSALEATLAAMRPERSILSREADSTYWMARYVERAENVARLLLASTECLVDVRDMAPGLLERQWLSVLRIMHVDEPTGTAAFLSDRVSSHMTFEEDNPNSLVACLTRARENARGIREGLSSDMWEHLNRLYWAIRSEEAHVRFQESPHELYREVIDGAMSFHGLTDETLPHDQRWHFAQLGKQFERITYTCRVLVEASTTPLTSPAELPLRNIHWSTVLRCCNSLEAIRRAHPGELDPSAITTFLLLEETFPRSVRHCVARAKDSITAIAAEVRLAAIDPAERILGRLQAQLDYADAAEFCATGPSSRLDDIVWETARAALAVQNSYFLH